jgi:hypothetical protein
MPQGRTQKNRLIINVCLPLGACPALFVRREVVVLPKARVALTALHQRQDASLTAAAAGEIAPQLKC